MALKSPATRRTSGKRIGAGWSSPVARQAHNLKVVGSNPTPATNFFLKTKSCVTQSLTLDIKIKQCGTIVEATMS